MSNVNRRRFLRTAALATLTAAFSKMTSASQAAEARHSSPPAPGRPIPVILDTDIGSDIDDTWALAYLLRCPELDLKLVLTATGDTRYRAKIAAKLLQAAGRTDVPVGMGKNFGPMLEKDMNQAPWVQHYKLEDYPGRIVEDGISALIETIMVSPDPITLISIGPATNIALALKKEPRLASRCRFVGMDGSFDVGYGGGPPVAESNVRSDPEALRTTLAAVWKDVLLTPLDTCGNVTLEGADYHALWCDTKDPLVRSVIENYCIFAPRVSWMICDYFALHSTVLYDCVAVYLAHSEQFAMTEPVRFRITDDGRTVRDPGGLAARLALRWNNRMAFERHLANRLLQRGNT
jgi:inosine-uridine nucleoside N-ribohydrolase